MKGVILLSIGSPVYARWAHNMAITVRVMSPNLPIHVVTDGNFPFEPEHANIVDKVIKMDESDYLKDGKLYPAKAKLSLYDYSEFEETIYLDVDGCCVRDLNELFDRCDELGKPFQVQVNGISTKDKDNLDASLWVKPKQIFEKYEIDEDAQLPGTNSSFWYFKKCEESSALFEKALENLSNPFEVRELRYQWGRSGTQPDELYMNIALGQLGYMPNIEPVLYLRKRDMNGRSRGLDEIQANYYVIGCWGDENYNHWEISGTGQVNSGLYNKHVSICWNTYYKNSSKFGKPYDFFSLIGGKVFGNKIK